MSVSICVASGKGGVGKSTFTANLGLALARAGHSTVIVDADIGLRAQDTLLNLADQVVYDLVDVVHQDCLLDQALLSSPAEPQLKLLPAAQFARVRSVEPKMLRKILAALRAAHEFVLVDCPAGIEKGFRTVLAAGGEEMILLATPDDLCIRDAERACQIVEAKKLPRPRLVVNRLDNDLIRRGEMYSARVVAETLDLALLGEIPEDPAVYRAMLRRCPALDIDCEARRAFLRIAERLTGRDIPLPEYGKYRIPFLRRLLAKELREVTPLEHH